MDYFKNLLIMLRSYVDYFLNHFTFKTPTYGGVLSDNGNSIHALEKCEGVKRIGCHSIMSKPTLSEICVFERGYFEDNALYESDTCSKQQVDPTLVGISSDDIKDKEEDIQDKEEGIQDISGNVFYYFNSMQTNTNTPPLKEEEEVKEEVVEEVEIFRISPKPDTYYEFATFTRETGEHRKNNKRYFTNKTPQYVGLFIETLRSGYGDGGQVWSIFEQEDGTRIRIDYTYEGTTCFKEVDPPSMYVFK